MKYPKKVLAALSLILVLCCSSAICQDVPFERFCRTFMQEHGIPVVKDESTLSASQIGTKSFALSSQLHKTIGSAYVIITDVKDGPRKKALSELADFHHGTIIQVPDLGLLEKNPSASASLRDQLLEAKPRFVAIAPRPENYRENVQLALMSVFSQLDGSGEIAVFPGWLTAPDDASFARLLQHSYNSKTLDRAAIQTMIFAQVPGPRRGGTRSVSKAALLQQFFQALGCTISACVVKTDAAIKAGIQTPLFDAQEAVVKIAAPRLNTIPDFQSKQFSDANLILLFGHGMPGMTCSVDVGAFNKLSFENKIVLCGSCFSAASNYSDFRVSPETDDVVESKIGNGNSTEVFADRAVANGAGLFYGQMVTNEGFPELYVILSNIMKGEPAGEAYQKLLNNRIEASKLTPAQFVLPAGLKSDAAEKEKRSELLYVLIGDPASRPLNVEVI